MNFRVNAPSLDFHVDVRLRCHEGRWLSVADIAGEHEIGVGRTAREALAASLSSLGAAATTALLADPALVRVADMGLPRPQGGA